MSHQDRDGYGNHTGETDPGVRTSPSLTPAQEAERIESLRFLVLTMIQPLVSDPTKIKITDTTTGRRFIGIEVDVPQEDRGKVIGRGGRIAEAMRTVVQAAASNMLGGREVHLEVLSDHR